MTVGEALARAEELRPGCQITARTRQRWLVELDGMLREKFFKTARQAVTMPWARTGHGTINWRRTLNCWPRPL